MLIPEEITLLSHDCAFQLLISVSVNCWELAKIKFRKHHLCLLKEIDGLWGISQLPIDAPCIIICFWQFVGVTPVLIVL